MNLEKPRQIAARVLRRHAMQADFLESLFEKELEGVSLSTVDRRLAQELAFGVVRWQGTLDWLIARKTAGRAQKPPMQILLRLGLYQMFWLDRIPDHAAVYETVEMAKRWGLAAKTGFVNAVLRSFLREREQIEQQLATLKDARPDLGYSHPDWLCGRWEDRWGGENLRLLLKWNNTPPATYARLNTLRASSEQLTAKWAKEGVQFKPRQWDWVREGLVYELESHPPLTTLASFQQGWFYIQDPSTLLAVVVLNPQPGEMVLDLCAAPGGKTTLIAQLMSNRGRIVARDPHSARRDLVRENCLRLGVTCVEMAVAGPQEEVETSQRFDRVLVDAPCSNTGVMRRRVDLRWRLRIEEIGRLQTTQLALLGEAAAQLKAGGSLVYSTCSLEPEENEQVVQSFLATHPDFRRQTERTLLPFVEGVDGAYVAECVCLPGQESRRP